MSTQTNTTTKFVVFGAWNKGHRMYLASEYSTGVINFKAFDTQAEAQAELENWLNAYDGCEKITDEMIAQEYADYAHDFLRDNEDEADQLESQAEYTERNYPNGEGWYKSGSFVGYLNDDTYKFDGTVTGMAEATVTVEQPEEGDEWIELITTYKFGEHEFSVDSFDINR